MNISSFLRVAIQLVEHLQGKNNTALVIRANVIAGLPIKRFKSKITPLSKQTYGAFVIHFE